MLNFTARIIDDSLEKIRLHTSGDEDKAQSIIDGLLNDNQAILDNILSHQYKKRLLLDHGAITINSLSMKLRVISLRIGSEIHLIGWQQNYNYLDEDILTIQECILSIINEHINLSNLSTSGLKQYEAIQLINNELVNTKRMLEKSNAQLNVLNSELNNRLVKDPLTGLVSKYQYHDEIKKRISQNPSSKGIFVFIDIDDFKTINDNYGHAQGDRYLVKVAEWLTNFEIPHAIRMRIAGDEFGLFIYGLDEINDNLIDEYWRLLVSALDKYKLDINEKWLDISVSAGFAVFNQDTTDIYEVIEFADFAMYKAKQAGKSQYRVFDYLEYNSVKGKNIKKVD